MKPEPPARRYVIAEQWWVGVACLLFWAVAIFAFARSCSGGECRVAWDAAPVSDQVKSWRVYRGIDLLATVTDPRATLTIPDSLSSSLTVRAVNVVGESAPSAPLVVIPITVQASTDLKIWAPVKVIHRERKPAEFFRLKIEP